MGIGIKQLEHSGRDRHASDYASLFRDPGRLAVATAPCQNRLGGPIAPTNVFPQPVLEH
jgi:hypothetical protein